MIDPLELALSGAQDMANGQKPYWDDLEREKQRNKPLSAYEKWLGKVMSGEITPEHGGIAAKLEQAGHPAFSQPAQEPAQAPQGLAAPPQQSYGYQPGMHAVQSAPPGLADPRGQPEPYPAQQGLRSAQLNTASRPAPPPAPAAPPTQGLAEMGGPETRGDFNSMVSVAPLIKSKRQMSSDEMAFKYWQEGQRNNRNERSVGQREDTAASERSRKEEQFEQELGFKKRALSQHLQETLLKLQNRLELAHHASGSNEKIALLKALIQDANGAERNVAEIMKSDPYLTKDKAAHEEVFNARSRTYDIRQQATKLLQQMQAQGVGQSSSTSSTVTGTTPAHTTESLNALFGK